MYKELPKLRPPALTSKISLAVEADTKNKLEEMKWKHGINVSEWLRQIIEKELGLIDLEKKSS